MDVEVTLGGVWKQHHATKTRLETAIRELEQELTSTKRDNDTLRSTASATQETLHSTREQFIALRAEHDSLLRSHHTNLRTLDSQKRELEHLQNALEEQLTLNETLQRDIAGSRGEARVTRSTLSSAERTVADLTSEVSTLQLQFDQMETTAHDLSTALDGERRKVALLTKVKQQKEDHVLLLIKEKDRLFRKLTRTRSLLKRSMDNALTPRERETALDYDPATPLTSTTSRRSRSPRTPRTPASSVSFGTRVTTGPSSARRPLSPPRPPPSFGSPSLRSPIDELATPKARAGDGSPSGRKAWTTSLRQSDATEHALEEALLRSPTSASVKAMVRSPSTPVSSRRGPTLDADETQLLTRRVGKLKSKVDALTQDNEGLKNELRRLREERQQSITRYRVSASRR